MGFLNGNTGITVFRVMNYDVNIVVVVFFFIVNL